MKLGGRLASACGDPEQCSSKTSLRSCLATRWQQSLQRLSRLPAASETVGSGHQPACGSLSAASAHARWPRHRWHGSAALSHAFHPAHCQQRGICTAAAVSNAATGTMKHPATAEAEGPPGDDLTPVSPSRVRLRQPAELKGRCQLMMGIDMLFSGLDGQPNVIAVLRARGLLQVRLVVILILLSARRTSPRCIIMVLTCYGPRAGRVLSVRPFSVSSHTPPPHRSGAVQDMTSPELEKAASKEQLSIYCGFDPTAESLHLGNLMGILVLSWFSRHAAPRLHVNADPDLSHDTPSCCLPIRFLFTPVHMQQGRCADKGSHAGLAAGASRACAPQSVLRVPHLQMRPQARGFARRRDRPGRRPQRQVGGATGPFRGAGSAVNAGLAHALTAAIQHAMAPLWYQTYDCLISVSVRVHGFAGLAMDSRISCVPKRQAACQKPPVWLHTASLLPLCRRQPTTSPAFGRSWRICSPAAVARPAAPTATAATERVWRMS